MNTLATSQTKSKRHKAALRYAKWGWAVFPVHSMVNGKCSCGVDCSSPGKHPKTKSGCLDATTDERKITGWWDRWPDANIGIATGKRSGISVLDGDENKGGLEALATLAAKRVRDFYTPVISRTGGGGVHLFFKHKAGVTNSSKQLPDGIKGIDIRGEGGYIVAPESNHKSGRMYQWLEIDITKIRDLPLFPELKKTTREKRLVASEEMSRGAANKMNDTIGEGSRNSTLASYAGRCRKQGMDEQKIEERVLEKNRRDCSPPLSDDEARAIAKSVSRYAPGTVTATGKTMCALSDSGNAEHFAMMFSKNLRYDHQRCVWLIWRKHFWEVDERGKVTVKAKMAARKRQRDALEIDDSDRRKPVMHHALRSEDRDKIGACIDLARSTPPLADDGKKMG